MGREARFRPYWMTTRRRHGRSLLLATAILVVWMLWNAVPLVPGRRSVFQGGHTTCICPRRSPLFLRYRRPAGRHCGRSSPTPPRKGEVSDASSALLQRDEEGQQLLREALRRTELKTIMRVKTGQACILERWHYKAIMRRSPPRRTGTRTRGAGRPRRARQRSSSRSSARSGDSGPGEPGEPPPLARPSRDFRRSLRSPRGPSFCGTRPTKRWCGS
jgi:hypothetical protein